MHMESSDTCIPNKCYRIEELVKLRPQVDHTIFTIRHTTTHAFQSSILTFHCTNQTRFVINRFNWNAIITIMIDSRNFTVCRFDFIFYLSLDSVYVRRTLTHTSTSNPLSIVNTQCENIKFDSTNRINLSELTATSISWMAHSFDRTIQWISTLPNRFKWECMMLLLVSTYFVDFMKRVAIFKIGADREAYLIHAYHRHRESFASIIIIITLIEMHGTFNI